MKSIVHFVSEGFKTVTFQDKPVLAVCKQHHKNALCCNEFSKLKVVPEMKSEGEKNLFIFHIVSESWLRENSEYVNPEMRETGFSISKWEVCQTRESRVIQAHF